MVIGRTPEATYWEFFRADRAKDARAWAAVLNYPHVRVAAPGRVEYFESPKEFIAAATWSEREATGWVRTEGIEPRAIQTAPDKLHLAGGWVRYDAEDQPILSNRVVYVLTKPQERWGVQARLACGATPTWRDVGDQEPANVVRRFLQLLKDDDFSGCAGLVRYPFVVVGLGAVQWFETESSFTLSLREFKLSPHKIEAIKVVQNGRLGSNVAVSLQFDAGDQAYAIFLIDKRNSQYLIATMSLINLSIFKMTC